MLAHAASSSALPWPLVSRPVSRQSRLRTLVFPGKTGGFAVKVVGFELVGVRIVVEIIAGTDISGMLASSLDTGCLGRNSLSLHPMMDRLSGT
jgi:hypothetical protein